MDDLLLFVESIELSANDYANSIFSDISLSVLSVFLVLILSLYFAGKALSFLKNI